MKMKRLMLLVAALPVLFLAGCKKEKVDPLKPNVMWESNANFGVVELTDRLDAVVQVYAPGKIQEVKLVLNLGSNNNLVNQYIKLEQNKSKGGSNPVMDLVEDESSANLLGGLGMRVGKSLIGQEKFQLDLKKILERILQGQPVENNTTFTIEIRVTDQASSTDAKTARFHFTAAPSISWPKNTFFTEVDLDADAIECKVEILAPGKIDGLKVKLEDGADPAVTSKVKNRTTASVTLIDLIGDTKVADGFKGYFPASSDISGKDRAVLDFGFLYDWKYDMSGASKNVFTITATDQNGKETVQKVTFKKN